MVKVRDGVSIADEMASNPSLLPAPVREHPGRLLGDVIVGLGLCDRETVEGIVVEAREAGRPMGQLLREQGLIDSEGLTIALAERFGLEYASLDGLVPDLAAMHLVAPAALRRLGAVPLAFRDDDTLLVAMSRPSNVLALDGLARLTDLQVEPVVVSDEDLGVLLARLGDHELVVEAAAAAPGAAPDPHAGTGFLRSVMRRAIEEGASDVHFDPDGGDLQVRYRVDGFMVDAARVRGGDSAQVVAQIKTLGDLDPDERRLPQNGRTRIILDERPVDLRVTTVPVLGGESAVLRLLDPGRRPPSLGELGMDHADRARLERALAQSHGLILATGPRDAGKSTLLYAAAEIVNSPSKTVVTIEERIHYHLPGVQQVQVVEQTGLSFAGGLRAIVQADPDIVMVGELRDRETAQIAAQAAVTDHLVLSTLHTTDAPAAAARLVEIGVEPYIVAASLRCIVAQRLARRLCEHCRRPARVAAADAGLPRDGDLDVYEAGGCDRCRDTGYHGRTGLFEVMTVSEELRALIRGRASAAEIRRTAMAQGMRTLADDGLAKVRLGVTSLAEVRRITT